MHITACPRCQGRIRTVRVVPGFSYGVDRECVSCGWIASRWEGLKRERMQCLDCGDSLLQENATHYHCRSCGGQFRSSLEQLMRIQVTAPTPAETLNF